MRFSTFIVQFTEYKALKMAYYVMGCSLCPYALFSQARSHMHLKLHKSIVYKPNAGYIAQSY